jgi:hypothetical protein
VFNSQIRWYKLEFVDLVNGINQSNDPLSYLIKLKEDGVSVGKPTNEEVEYHIETLFHHLERNDTRQALNIFKSFLFWKGSKSIAMMKRKGLFRSSKYKFKSKSLLEIVDFCLKHSDFFNIKENDANYLVSIKNLTPITNEVESYRADILRLLRKNSKFSPKTYLAIIESQFGYGCHLDGNENISSESLSHYSNEDFTESVSYLLTLFNDEIGLSLEHLNYVEPSEDLYDEYFKIIIFGCKIQQYIKAEILVNSFEYSATVVDDFKILIKSSDPYLEKSIRLGYIQTELQMRIREFHKVELAEKNVNSLKEIATDLFENNAELFIQLKMEPIARYILKFPAIPQFLDIFSSDYVFSEEIHSLMLLDMDSYGSKDLDSLLIFNTITVLDILKIQRLFRFINYIFTMALNSDDGINDREMLMLNTILPVMSHDNLKAIFSIILPQEKIDDCLNLICSDIDSTDHFDIQYTPILSIENGHIIAPAILSSSNLVRNILCNLSLRPSLSEGVDPMQNDLIAELLRQGFKVESECFLYGSSLETDILAFKDEHIFIIECKNSYHPCNVHEMRTSFDHIKKGIDQLDKRKNWLMQTKNQQDLFTRLGWQYKASEVITCIATSNRVFNGYKKNGNYVRQAHELLNVLKTGIINTNLAKYRVWKEDKFDTLDLVKHIQGNTTISDCFQSLIDVEREYLFTEKSLAFSTHELDLNLLNEVTGSRYHKIT